MIVRRGRAPLDKPRRDAPRRFWFDPRFGVGIGLIAVSVLGVVGVVAAADTRVVVYSARAPLSPGDLIDAGDLIATSVRIDGAERLYVVQGELPEAGFVITRAVGRGELVPASAVGAEAGVRQASVVLVLDGELAASVGPGSTVDVWAARESGTGIFDPPVVIVSSATVVRLVEPAGFVVDGGAGSIEVIVPRDRIARVLEALANDDAVSIVPVSIPGK